MGEHPKRGSWRSSTNPLFTPTPVFPLVSYGTIHHVRVNLEKKETFFSEIRRPFFLYLGQKVTQTLFIFLFLLGVWDSLAVLWQFPNLIISKRRWPSFGVGDIGSLYPGWTLTLTRSCCFLEGQPRQFSSLSLDGDPLPVLIPFSEKPRLRLYFGFRLTHRSCYSFWETVWSGWDSSFSMISLNFDHHVNSIRFVVVLGLGRVKDLSTELGKGCVCVWDHFSTWENKRVKTSIYDKWNQRSQNGYYRQ